MINYLSFIKNLFFTKAYAQAAPTPAPTPWPLLLQPPHAGAGSENYELIDVLYLIGNIISIFLILASVVAVIYIIIGGFKYVSSVGNPETIQQAKSTLLWAIIGLVICLAAVLIVRFVWSKILGTPPPESF